MPYSHLLPTTSLVLLILSSALDLVLGVHRHPRTAAATIDLAKSLPLTSNVLIKLHDKICRERGDGNFATDWTLIAFKYGVSDGVLSRVLTPQEITAMNFDGGFEPRQVYDGFITKFGDHYECGLCKEDKKTYWKAKKNAPRHLRKFHFGLADVCKSWYAPSILDIS